MKRNINIIHTGRLKMKKYFSVFALVLSLSSFAQTTTENYVYSKVILSENGSKKSETIQYFDGLGRPKQTIQVKSTPLGQDLVVAVTYDQLGRQTKSILPVPMATTSLGIQNVSEATANAYYGVPNAYGEQKLEASPLARVLETAGPGSEWAMNSGHTRKAAYEINKNSDKVKKFSFTNSWVSATTVSSVPTVSFYNEKVLVKTSGTDEDGNKTIEFTNGLGQTILVRKVISATENADTYYLYNDYGHLVYVISPKAEAQITSNNNIITQQILDDLCYQYKYDNKNRLIEKKIPGKGLESMIYDRQNRLVGSQDAELKKKGQWLYTKYDQFGRVAITGISTGNDRAQEQEIANGYGTNNVNRINTALFERQGMNVYYDNPDATYPNATKWATLLSLNYYDTYPSYSFNPVFPSAIFGKPVLKDNPADNNNTKTMPVMSLVKNIEDDNWTKNYSYYDTKGRPVGGYSINHLGGYTRTESELDFTGLPIQVKTYHKRLATDTERVITENFTYDNQNRLLTHTHQVDNNTPEILTQNKYNELSQLQSKKVGGTSAASPLQTVDYTYNIRGWITKINDPSNLGNDLFGYKINYNQVDGLEIPNSDFSDLKVKPKYNGNIAEVSWKTLTEDNEPLKRYGYVYDGLNRLSAGFYQKAGTEAAKEYFEKLEYDINGNITRLKRSEGILPGSTAALSIDNLKYDYSGNRLIKITDEQQNPSGYPYLAVPNPIEYDNGNIGGNGNITKHLDKGISSIEYNYLNLPDKITQNSKVTSYLYRADGVKVKKLFGDLQTHYLDGFQYKSTFLRESWDGEGTFIPDPNEIPELKLRIIPTSEGYYDALLNKYVYNFTDHLGNVRVSYTDTNGDGIIQPRRYNTSTCSPIFGCLGEWKPGEIVEVNNYYPFGLMHNYEATTQNAYQYKYNGKELQESGMYDYGARFYMPDLGRWGVVDPLAEASRRFTPYHYGNNNPIRFIDPDGRLTVDNLQGGYTRGSAVADFMQRTGLAAVSEQNMPLFYRDEGGAMIRTDAVGNDGQGGGSGPTPKSNTGPGAIERFISWLFGGKKGAGISAIVPGAVISRTHIVEVGEPIRIAEFFSAIEATSVAVGAATLGAVLTPVMMKDPEYNWTRDLPLTVPTTVATDVPADESGNLYLYRNMRNVNGMPMVGEGLDKLGLRDRDVNLLSNSTMITPLFANGLSVTVGYGDVIPPNVPDFSRGKGTIFRISASSLMSYGLVGLPVLNPDVPNYGQIRPAIPMNVGTFRALIQSTAPAWQPVK
ncbi:DUF6443 domain-containing protein [Chryseobacterium gleum]|uniref:DUF6443 domain-containing protein n=1 Tax=Chryseobacterium gleum TaxID=250 RepID=UPI0028A16C00|nr:DUF6443 domain-containing protein [Chryseobacterium gleum]